MYSLPDHSNERGQILACSIVSVMTAYAPYKQKGEENKKKKNREPVVRGASIR